MKFQPAIKWSGSKRSQSDVIVKQFPNRIDTYYEPFCGGCSVVRTLIESDIKVKRYVCSDMNSDLINLWKEIKEHPQQVSLHYNILWSILNKDDDRVRKRDYFETVRERLNTTHNPLDFMFIMRTCTNGMPRYNAKGEFNNSFHLNRNGINPSTLAKIVKEWSELLNRYDVQFIACDYAEIEPNEGDFVYLDPPYANTNAMYHGAFDNKRMFEWMRTLKCGYALSYDGISGTENRTYRVPTDLYNQHIYIESGNSSFKRIKGSANDCVVFESLYMKTV